MTTTPSQHHRGPFAQVPLSLWERSDLSVSEKWVVATLFRLCWDGKRISISRLSREAGLSPGSLAENTGIGAREGIIRHLERAGLVRLHIPYDDEGRPRRGVAFTVELIATVLWEANQKDEGRPDQSPAREKDARGRRKRRSDAPLLCDFEAVRHLVDEARGFRREGHGPRLNEGDILYEWAQLHPLEDAHRVINYLQQDDPWWSKENRMKKYFNAEHLVKQTPRVLALLHKKKEATPRNTTEGTPRVASPVMTVTPRGVR